MTRRAATIQTPATLWNDIEATVRGFGKFFTSPAADGGFDAIERENARIRLSSRHWLMG